MDSLYTDLNNYLMQFCSSEALKQLFLTNKKFHKVSEAELKNRASKTLIVFDRNLFALPLVYPEEHLCKGDEIDYSKIEILKCYNNQLIYLPDNLWNCKYLDCSLNLLTSLPDSLGNCEELHCDHNLLTSLPDCLGKCKDLVCNYNQITSLPDCLENCEYLSLINNNVTLIPPCLSCYILSCAGNNIDPVSLGIYMKKISSRNTQSQPVV